ncbi:MAG: Holliday junction resolvase [Gemmatimonadetes bacterium]|nr:MAG: Holliday junction resolvase [Gemmatimonadota bacterium]
MNLLLGAVIGLLVALVAFLAWKGRYTRAVRADAIVRSQAVITGRVSEQLLPFLPGFGFNPKDARFLGSPVDFVVFDGLDEGALRRVVFVEVKTGDADLSPRERQVRDAVQGREVEWLELTVRTTP